MTTRARRARGATLERDDQGRKLCVRCDTWKSVDAFRAWSRASDGLNPWCGRCIGLSQYSITSADYDRMLADQGGTCDICDRVNADGSSLSVDHDHACCLGQKKSCGRCIRALLCKRCNTALGMVGDDRERLLSLVTYLDRFRSN